MRTTRRTYKTLGGYQAYATTVRGTVTAVAEAETTILANSTGGRVAILAQWILEGNGLQKPGLHQVSQRGCVRIQKLR